MGILNKQVHIEPVEVSLVKTGFRYESTRYRFGHPGETVSTFTHRTRNHVIRADIYTEGIWVAIMDKHRYLTGPEKWVNNFKEMQEYVGDTLKKNTHGNPK